MAGYEAYEFGSFVLEVSERRLAKNGRIITLPPKAFDLLTVLVRQAGQLVTKRELLDEVWAETNVEEGILAVHVSRLRTALEDRHPTHRFIDTVPRAGYRFTAAVGRRPTPEVLSMRWPIGTLPSRPAVSELIGRGRAHLSTNSRPEIPKAVAAFRSAIDLDPTYAPAHAGLALAWCAQAELRIAPHGEAYSEARAASLRALAMDSRSADAQVALGAVLFLSDWNWTGAGRCFERALEIDPDHTDAYLLYGRLLDALGAVDRGLPAKLKALERNPFSALVHLQIALSYWNQRQYDQVIEWANRALSLDARHLLAREYTAGAYLMKGDYDRHMAESIEHAQSFGVPLEALAPLRKVYAEGGRRAVVEYAIEEATKHGEPALQLAVLHGELGNLDEAFRHLDRALESRDPCVVDVGIAPQWDCLRHDPRLAERLARMGLTARTPFFSDSRSSA